MTHRMLMPTLNQCPHCRTNLIGGLIADTVGEEAAKHYAGTHWRKEIGVEIPEVYDGTLYYRCPDCGGAWHRWAPGSGLHEKAIPYMNAPVQEENNVPLPR